jgi:hypothetical protein
MLYNKALRPWALDDVNDTFNWDDASLVATYEPGEIATAIHYVEGNLAAVTFRTSRFELKCPFLLAADDYTNAQASTEETQCRGEDAETTPVQHTLVVASAQQPELHRGFGRSVSSPARLPVYTPQAYACPVALVVSPANAAEVVFSSTTGMACDVASSSSRMVRDCWGLATAAACLVASGKRPELFHDQVMPEGHHQQWRAWVRNHYRWVVWKLAAVTRQFGTKRLTFKNVVAHLKRRFECELERTTKSALKAICHHDASETNLLVLVVVRVCRNGMDETLVELTDGWYNVGGLLDEELASRCVRGQIRVGTKLIIQGARLIDGASAADPVDLLVKNIPPPTLRLEINGTRLARSSARLGFQESGRTMVLLLSCLSLSGGVVPAVDAIVQRIRPPDRSGRTPTLTVVWLVAPGSSGLPTVAELRLRNDAMDNACAQLQFCEGDAVRVYHMKAVPGPCGSLRLRSTHHSRYEARQSPASRCSLAACHYVPRVLFDGARLASLGRNRATIGSRVDAVGLFVMVQDDFDNYATLILYDASPNLVFFSVEQDFHTTLPSSLVGLAPGTQVAVLNAIILATHHDAAILTCDELVVFCNSNRPISDEVPISTRVSFQNDWDALERWSKTTIGQNTAPRALKQLDQRMNMSLSRPPSKLRHVVKTLKLLNLIANFPDGAAGADLGLNTNAACLDAVLEIMQTDGILYISDGRHFYM